MNLTEGKQAETDAIPDSLLQTLGVMKNVSRSMDYIEERLYELGELGEKDLDPRLRREVRQLRGDMSEVASQVLFRLSLMGTIIAELLKEAEKDRHADPGPSGEARREQGRARKARKRFEVVPAFPR